MPRVKTPTDPFLDALRSGWTRFGLRQPGVLLAVSGGGDSAALLVGTALLSTELGLRLEVACVDHGLRPGSRAELESVAELAGMHGLPFHGLSVSLAPGADLEARARAARYEALEVTRVARGLDFIATAHTATDQAETLMMRLGRGTAPAGAAGIRARRGQVLRPMLGCTREEVRAFLARRAIPFHDDPMNFDPAFLRVRVRQEVLPALERSIGRASVQHLARFAQLAADDEAVLQEQALGALGRIRLEGGELDAVGLRALPPAIRRRVLVAWLEELGERIDFARIALLEDALVRGKEAPLGGRAVVRTTGDRVRRVRAEIRGVEKGEWLLSRGGAPVKVGALCLRWRTAPSGERSGQVLPEGLPSPLTVRTRRAGDRVRSGNGATRKLQDLLVDEKVPRERRDELPVILDSQGLIVCVVGIWPKPGEAPPGREVIEAQAAMGSGACPDPGL